MTAREARLAIHHHGVFFVESSGAVWLPSFVGPWIQALCSRWREVLYLGQKTPVKGVEQDTIVRAENFRAISLGPPGEERSLLARLLLIRNTMQQVRGSWDILLVRGPTPRQGTVLNHDTCGKQAMLLVGDPPQTPLLSALRGGGRQFYLEMLNRRRRAQTAKLGGDRFVMANSLALCKKWEDRLGKVVPYVSTSSLSEDQRYSVEDRFLTPPFRLLFVGRICAAKGVQDILRSLNLMRAAGIQVTLDVAGDAGEGESIVSFQNLAEELNVAELIRWHGKVPFGEELFRFFREADALVLPSRHEGFPRVLWEAFAHSVPVVVTPVGGIPQLCRGGSEVLFVRPGAPDQIVSAIESLVRDPKLRQRLIRNGRTLQEGHTVTICAERLTTCLEQGFLNG